MLQIDYRLNQLDQGSRPLDDFTKAATLRDMATGNQLKQLQMDQTRQTMGQQQALFDQQQAVANQQLKKKTAIDNLFKQYSSPNGIDNKSLVPALYQVDPEYATAYEKSATEHSTALEELKKKEFDNNLSQWKSVANVLSGAETPAQWDAGKTFLKTNGLTTLRTLDGRDFEIPDYNPDFKVALNNMITTSEERFKQNMENRKQDETERHNKAQEKIDLNKANNTSGDVGKATEDFKNQIYASPALMNIAKLYAFGHMSEQETMAKVPGFNKAAGPARLALTEVATEINPPVFDDKGNLISGFNPKGFGISRKVEDQSRSGAGTVLNKQRMAAQRALSTFDDAFDKTKGTYQNIPDWMYRDLASDYAKILVASGQISEGGVDKIMQKSAKGAIVGIYNFVTGDTKTTAPEKVLNLLHDRIKALNTDLDKQYYNQVNGTNLDINSNSETNPLNPKTANDDFNSFWNEVNK